MKIGARVKLTKTFAGPHFNGLRGRVVALRGDVAQVEWEAATLLAVNPDAREDVPTSIDADNLFEVGDPDVWEDELRNSRWVSVL